MFHKTTLYFRVHLCYNSDTKVKKGVLWFCMDSNLYLGICHKCGCNFIYDNAEIKKNLYQSYTDCPVCGKEVKADKKPFTFNGQKATEYKMVIK